MEKERLHFKLKTNYTFKDLVESNKCANQIAFLGGRLSIIIFLLFYLYNYSVRNVEAYDLFFVEGVSMCFNDPLFIVLLISSSLLCRKLPVLFTWGQIMYSDKRKTSKTITRTYSFYDTYFTILTDDSTKTEDNDISEIIIKYSFIFKLYESKYTYVLRTNSLQLIPIPKRLLNDSEIISFKNFIQFSLEKSKNNVKKKQDV